MRMLARFFAVLTMVVMSSSGLPGQVAATRVVMRDKLAHSEKILEAIMTSNYGLLQRESESLAQMTKSPGWDVLKTPTYARYSAAFLMNAEDLVEAAQQRDSDAATMRYVALTLSCYDCHRYLKGIRVVK